MAKTLTAVFDGEALRLEESADLEVNGRYKIVIGDRVPDGGRPSAWDILESMKGSVSMPEDWSAETDHYLYGTPKRSREADE
jgi:hypothetical protein